MIDPVLQVVVAFGLAILFAAAARHKWADHTRFRQQLDAYRLLPGIVVAPAAWLLAGLETTVALGLLLPGTRAFAGLAAAALLTGYALAMAVNLARGRRHIDCGCGGDPLLLSPWLLLRNGMLTIGALLLALPVSARQPGWQDLAVALPALAAVVLTYLATHQLIDNASVFREWRDSRD